MARDKLKTWETSLKAILEDVLCYSAMKKAVWRWEVGQSGFRFYHWWTSDTLPAQFRSLWSDKRFRSGWLSKKRCCSNSKRLSSQTKRFTTWFHLGRWARNACSGSQDNWIKYDGAYSYNACRLPYNLIKQGRRCQKLVKKMQLFKVEKPVCGLWFERGLNNHQAASFWHRLSFAYSEQEKGYLKL